MDFLKNIVINIDKTLLGSITLLFTIALSGIDFFFDKADSVSMGTLYIILWVCYLISIVQYCIFKSKQDIITNRNSFKILATKIDTDKVLLILKANSLLSINTVVSIYKMDSNDIEEFIGLGMVYNIQDEDKKVQIKLYNSPEYFKNKKIDLKNTLDNIESLKVKLSLNNDNIQDLINGGI